jgi:putative flippase GtrA
MNIKARALLLLQRYSFLIRYGISGVIGALVQTLTLYIWVTVLGLRDHYLWGLVVGFCVTLLISFSLQKYWTFADKVHSRLPRQFMFYTVTALGSLGLNSILLYASKQIVEGWGFDFFDKWYLLAQIIIIFMVAVCSFLVNYFVTFKEVKKYPVSN